MSVDRAASEPALLVERDGAVATFTINAPPRNRMSLEFMDTLDAEVARVAVDPAAHHAAARRTAR